MSLLLAIPGTPNGTCPFREVKSYHRNAGKAQVLWFAVSSLWFKKKPVATPDASRVFTFAVLVGLFARLLFTSLKPFILFTVIYSHAEASHYSRRRKSQKTVRLKEMSKHYKGAPFSLRFCYNNIAIFSHLSLSFEASHLLAAADSAFKPVVLYFPPHSAHFFLV